jgi:predicted DNA-binding transcriptional regulator AlpA
VVDNLLKLVGLSKWTIYKARQEGIGSAVMKTVLPPAPLVDQLWKDIRTAGDNKGLETVQSIPLVGKFYYWWLGRGVLKRPISDDAMYLKTNASRLGLSRTRAYQAMNRAITDYQAMPRGPKRDAAKARALGIVKTLAGRVRAREDRLAEIENRRQKRAEEKALSR